MPAKMMKFLVYLAILAGMCLLTASKVPASPREALFFPDSARVWDAGEFEVKDKNSREAVRLELPAQADPSTFFVRPEDPDQFSITDVQWSRTDPEDSMSVRDLRQKIREHESSRQKQEAVLKAYEARIAFWESRRDHHEDAGRMDEVATHIFEALKLAYQEKSRAGDELKEIENKLQELRDRLREITGEEQKTWEVLVFLDGADGSGTAGISFNYILSGCGWEPEYRLQADSAEGRVQFTWQARVWQSSGHDWKNTHISLATLQPQIDLDPPGIPDWIVRPVPKIGLPGPRDVRMAVMETAADEAPIQERRGQFSVWHLGEQDLAAGERPRIKIQEESWPAEFVRLLRPSRSDKGFLRAQLELDEVQNIPRGEAMFYHDQAMMGRRDFSFTGTEKTLYFGEDPFVTGESITKASASGTRGIIRERQTYRWHFLVNVHNHHDHPVRIRLEEPRPVLGDDNMQASFDLTPEPDRKTESLFLWEMELDGGEKREVDLQMKIQAPGDMDVDWGWRSR
ncbi:DUF4139 domain-containing protein [Desulfonatronospira sp.]|uniref:DUF4139 domain-containing protein n=1 Tax=Desulfonatronospira sp. TaxID=1962951 RepID=UPI0025C2D107|nr:DUF4139 domain-containing protein [Desulfonatronospira sp.]